MAEISKQVTDKKKSSDSVVAAVRANTARVESGITRTLGEPAGKAAATLAGALATRLETATSAMVSADDAHATELADDRAPRDARDAATAALVSEVVLVKEQLRTVAGPAFLVDVLAAGVTPSDPTTLERLATNMVARLQTAAAPPSLLPGYTVVPATFAERLVAPLEKLRTALAGVKAEEREAQGTLAARNAAVDAYDGVFSQVANALTVLMALAGEDELAGKVRPSRRKPGVTAADAGEEPVG